MRSRRRRLEDVDVRGLGKGGTLNQAERVAEEVERRIVWIDLRYRRYCKVSTGVTTAL